MECTQWRAYLSYCKTDAITGW